MRVEITETSGNPQTDYQVPVAIDAKTIDYDKTEDGGADIRFATSDEMTGLGYYIETWNVAGESTIWVEVPSLPASSTTTIFMYYGKPGASSESSGEAGSGEYVTVNPGEEEAELSRTDYFGGTAGIETLTDTGVTDGDVVLSGSSPGEVISDNVSLNGLSGWDTFYADHNLPANTDISYEVLKASDDSTLCSISAAQAAAGHDISSCADSTSHIQLYAELTTTDASTPYLQTWNVTREDSTPTPTPTATATPTTTATTTATATPQLPLQPLLRLQRQRQPP